MTANVGKTTAFNWPIGEGVASVAINVGLPRNCGLELLGLFCHVSQLLGPFLSIRHVCSHDSCRGKSGPQYSL